MHISNTQSKPSKDPLLALFIIPNLIGILLYIGWMVVIWFGLEKSYELQATWLLRFGLAVGLLFVFWGVWKQKKWAAILLLLLLFTRTWTWDTVAESYQLIQLIEKVVRSLLLVGFWWVFVGRLWPSFR